MIPCSYSVYIKEKKEKKKNRSEENKAKNFDFNINMNLLENPIWFPSRSSSKVENFVGDCYEIQSSMGMLDYFDITILYYLLSKLNGKKSIDTNTNTILKEIGLGRNGFYRKRIHEAIERLIKVVLIYRGKWIHVDSVSFDKEYKEYMFSIINAVISTVHCNGKEIKDKDMHISFNEFFLSATKDSIYYTENIDFIFFKLLKHPTAARLYEFLAKQFVFNSKYPTDVPVSFIKLSSKIGIQTRKRNGEEVLYSCMVKEDIADAVEKINSVVSDEKFIKENNINIDKIFLIRLIIDDNGFMFEKVLPEYVLKVMPDSVKNDPEFNNPSPIIIDRTKKELFLGGTIENKIENKVEEKIEEKKKEENHNDIY